MTALRWKMSCGFSRAKNSARIAARAPFVFRNWPYFFGSRYQHQEGILELRDGTKFLIRPQNTDRASITEVTILDAYSPVPEGAVVVDVGANIGAFTLTAAKRAKVVYAIEPVRSNFDILHRNVNLNRLDNVRTHRLALSDRNGTSPITCAGVVSSLYFQNSSSQTEQVPTATLETFLTEQRIDRIDYLKMDCEGAEWDILLSTPPEVLSRITQIEMEFHIVDTHHPSQLQEHLAKAGFVSTYTDPGQFIGALKARRSPEVRCDAPALSHSLLA